MRKATRVNGSGIPMGTRTGRKRLDPSDMIVFREQLQVYKDRHYPNLSRAEFAKRLRVPQSTVSRWFGSTKPARQKGGKVSRATAKAPELATLLHLARQTGTSLDWLLLAEGEMYRLERASTLAEQFEAYCLAALQSTGDVTAEEAKEAIAHAEASGVRLVHHALKPIFLTLKGHIESGRDTRSLEKLLTPRVVRTFARGSQALAKRTQAWEQWRAAQTDNSPQRIRKSKGK